MAADASIYAQFRRPVRSMSEYAADYDAAEGNALQLAAKRMQMQQSQRAMADEDAIRGLARQHGGDENALIRALRTGGYFDKAGGLEKQIAERLKAKSDLDTAEVTRRKTEADTEAARFTIAEKRSNAFESARAALEADPTLSRDKVLSVLQSMVDRDLLPMSLAQRMAQGLPDDPNALREDIRRGNLSRLSAKDRIELFSPKYEFKDSGQQLIPVQTNPNAPGFTPPTAIQKVATPGEVLTDTRTRAEGAANRGVTMRGQNMTDARAREANTINKELVRQKTALEIEALEDKATERNKAKQAAASSVESQIRVIDKALSHPGMGTATGLSGAIDPRNYVPGTDATDFRVVLDQIGGAAFLQAFEALKGGGAITEVEGKKATDAIARLSRAQSDSEFKKSLNDLRGVMETGYKRMTGKEYPQGKAATNLPKSGGLSAEDAQAREWAERNPDDPRAKKIMQRLGGG